MLPTYMSLPTHSLLRRTGRLLVSLLAFFAVQSATAQGPNITYTLKSNFKNGLRFANSVAADSAGNIFVTDVNSATLYKEIPNPDGTYTQSIISIGSGQPMAVAVDSADNLYVANDAQNVYKETPSGGSYSESIVASGFTSAYSVAVDAAGDVYVLDAGTGSVYLEKLSGSTYTRSTVVGGLNLSSGGGIAVDSAGNVYIAETANSRALKESLSNGTYTQSIVMDSSTYQDNAHTVPPNGIAVDSAGAVIITNQNFGIFKAVPNGAAYTTTPIVFGNASSVIAGVGASIDAHGNLYLADIDTVWLTLANELAESSSAENFGSVNVGTTAPAQTATFIFDVGGTLAIIPYGVSTQGDLTLDFQAATTQAANVCVSGKAYNPGDTCTVAATFTPTRPGVRYGAIALFAPSGTPIATSYLQGVGISPQVSFSPGQAATVGQSFVGIVTVDSSSNAIYSATGVGTSLRSFTNTHPVDVVTPTFTTGYTGSNGYSPTSNFGTPFGNGYVVDGAGNIVYADGFTASSTVPGETSFSAYDVNPTIPSQTMSGGNLIATNYGNAFLAESAITSVSVTPPYNNRPAVDGAGNLYFSDDNQNRILEEQYIHGAYNKQIVIATGLSNPGDVVVDATGAVYAADTGNNRIVKETPNGDGTYTQTVVDSGFAYPPEGLAIDRIGNLYFSLRNNVPGGLPFLLKETVASNTFTQSSLALRGSSGLDVDAAGDIFAAQFTPSGSTVLYTISTLNVATPPSFTFAQTAVGSTSSDSPQTVTVTNNGNAPLNFDGIAITTNFTLSPGSTCSQSGGSASLAAGASCTLLINFAPTQGGVNNGTLTLIDNHLGTPGSTQVIKLNGQATRIGTGAATLSPSTYNYGSVNVGSSASQSFTLMNTGNSAIRILSNALSNALFAVGGTACGTSLAAGASCAYTVVFTPAAAGAQTTTFSVTDDAGTQTAALTGTGAQATAAQAALTPAGGNFSSITAGTTSAPINFTLTNAGNAALSIISFGIIGANSSGFLQGVSTCGSSLAAGSSCTIAVTFSPGTAGSFAATLSVTDTVGTQTSTLTGTATALATTPDFTVTATPASQSVVSGSSATYSVSVASMSASFDQAVVLAASGLPAGATVTFSPASLTPGGSGAQSTMTIQTAAQRASSSGGPPWRPFSAPVLAAALLVLPFRSRRRILRGLACVLLLMGIAGSVVGCGGGFALPESNPTTSTITVTGTSGTLQHSTSVQISMR